MSCGVGRRHSSDLAWLWLWRRPGSYNCDWIPRLGTSMCHRCGHKKQKKKEQHTASCSGLRPARPRGSPSPAAGAYSSPPGSAQWLPSSLAGVAVVPATPSPGSSREAGLGSRRGEAQRDGDTKGALQAALSCNPRPSGEGRRGRPKARGGSPDVSVRRGLGAVRGGDARGQVSVSAPLDAADVHEVPGGTGD